MKFSKYWQGAESHNPYIFQMKIFSMRFLMKRQNKLLVRDTNTSMNTIYWRGAESHETMNRFVKKSDRMTENQS